MTGNRGEQIHHHFFLVRIRVDEKKVDIGGVEALVLWHHTARHCGLGKDQLLAAHFFRFIKTLR